MREGSNGRTFNYVRILFMNVLQNKQEDIYGNLDAYYAPASEENEIYSQLKTCGVVNISHRQIK